MGPRSRQHPPREAATGPASAPPFPVAPVPTASLRAPRPVQSLTRELTGVPRCSQRQRPRPQAEVPGGPERTGTELLAESGPAQGTRPLAVLRTGPALAPPHSAPGFRDSASHTPPQPEPSCSSPPGVSAAASLGSLAGRPPGLCTRPHPLALWGDALQLLRGHRLGSGVFHWLNSGLRAAAPGGSLRPRSAPRSSCAMRPALRQPRPAQDSGPGESPGA